ncbi:MAG: DNA primase [Candidatus Atribacteria bacterium]|nr:DNA primase [Candidatus Atribacteria bacterium]
MVIGDHSLDEIKQNINIVDLIAGYIDLKPAGKNYRGLCPFHEEKTPSFNVSPEKGIYHCFGCGAGGDIFNFIMKMENITFREAVRYLARKAGIELLESSSDMNNREQKEKERLFLLNGHINSYYQWSLQNAKEPLANTAREYVFTRRQLRPETVEQFGIGFSPFSGRQIGEYVAKYGYTGNDLITVGVGNINRHGELLDRFRGRMTFALHNGNGEIIGFAGRAMTEEVPKYLNIPESPLFSKGKNLYGLFFSKNEIRKLKTAILVEGYMDFLSLYESGVKHVVASMGTALTTDQATLLRRYAERVVICYDSDNAGKVATFRGMEMLSQKGLEVKIAILPTPLDPDSYVRQKGVASFLELIDHSHFLFDYQLELFINQYGCNSLDSRIRIVRGILPFLEAASDTVEKTMKIRSVSQKIHVPESLIYDILQRSPVAENRIDFFRRARAVPESGRMKAERYLIKFMIEEVKLRDQIRNEIPEEGFSLPEHQRLYQVILTLCQKGNFTVSEVIDVFAGDETMSRCISKICTLDSGAFSNQEEAVKGLIKTIRVSILKEKKKKLQEKLSSGKDYDMDVNILKQIQELNKELHGQVREEPFPEQDEDIWSSS